MKYLQKFVYWILPDWYQPGTQRMSYILTLGWGILITFGLQFIYFALFFASGFKVGYTINIISFIFCVISSLILKYTKYTWVAANIIAAVIFFNTCINAYFTGGLNSSILLWIPIIPIISIFILTRKQGFFWVIAALLVLIAFYFFFPNGSPQSVVIIYDSDFDIWFNLMLLTSVIWFSATVIDNAKNKAIQNAFEAREQAHLAADELGRFTKELEMELAQRQLAEYDTLSERVRKGSAWLSRAQIWGYGIGISRWVK